jgi:hypothetical protein
MIRQKRWAAAASMAAAVLAGTWAAAPAAAQETGIKGGISISRFQSDNLPYWDEPLVATTWGGHLRLRLFNLLTVQPELHVVTKGAAASQPVPAQLEDDQIRMEYLEVPLLVVLPLRIGAAEPYVMGGPAIMLESRCRSIIRVEGLRTNIPCDPPTGQLFERPAFDWGVVAAGGVAYPLLGGRVLLEGRHTWGMRDMHKGPGEAAVRNRTAAFHIGYAVGWAPRQQ